jgi:thiosulfate reductase cytochrome b subunit
MNSTAIAPLAAPAPEVDRRPIHPLWVRLTHWLNALAVLVLVTSGWRIYDAAPFFPFSIPTDITLGGWLGGALQWHFAAMWLLVFNGLVYLAVNSPAAGWRASSSRSRRAACCTTRWPR